MPDFPETSHSLIERVHDLADEASWVEFLGIYQPVVYRMARRRGFLNDFRCRILGAGKRLKWLLATPPYMWDQADNHSADKAKAQAD